MLLFDLIRLVIGTVCLFVFSTLLPIAVLVALNWGAYSFLQDTFYTEAWMTPALFVAAVFLSGVILRQSAKPSTLLTFFVSMLGLCLFTGLSWVDTHQVALYSHLLPNQYQADAIGPICLGIPAVGLLGMVFSNAFWFWR